MSKKQLNVAFFIRHFTERGTEVSIYNYAKYNEVILGNKSFIVCFTPQKQQSIGFPMERFSHAKFSKRFPVMEIGEIDEMRNVIAEYDIDFFYTQTAGGGGDVYKFEDKSIWGKCKTIKHCVFDTNYPESDFYISIGQCLNDKYRTNFPVIRYIVENVEYSRDNLRDELGITKDAIVLGRYGGMTEFNIRMAQEAIYLFLNNYINDNVYFVFMNTHRFYDHPRIKYLDMTVDLVRKDKFINTCDAMIHARQMGETFGAAISEFSMKNKPIITCNSGDNEHLQILGEKAVVYQSRDHLIEILSNIRQIVSSRNDWNAYMEFSPENIMRKFHEVVFSKAA